MVEQNSKLISLNYNEINLLLNECNLSDYQIQDVQQPFYDMLLFNLYGKGDNLSLLFTLNQRTCFFHLTKNKFVKNKSKQRFEAFLLSRLYQAKIKNISHIFNQRILKIDFERYSQKYILWIRLWASSPNAILTDSNYIIGDVLYRRPKRGEISGGFYNPEKYFYENPPKAIQADLYPVRFSVKEGNIHQQVENYFSKLEDETKNEIKEKLLNQFYFLEQKVRQNLNNVQNSILQKNQYIRYKEFGDLIYASLASLKKGDKSFKTVNFYNHSEIIEITLDPRLEPAQNAEKYYALYKKEKEAINHLKELEKNYLEQISKYQNLQELVEKTDELEKLKQLSAKYLSTPNREKKEKSISLIFSSNGFNIYVGRTSQENDELLRHKVKGNDWWLHVRDYPGSSVFIKCPKGKSVPLEVLLDAANLAFFYSKARQSGKADVYYTQVKYLRRAKDGPKGLFIPTQEKNLTINLDLKRIKKLKDFHLD